MSTIHFQAKLFTIGSSIILRLPSSVSAKLPSRGMTFVSGTMNGVTIHVPLEPDGKGSHWFKVDKRMSEKAHGKAGDTVEMTIEPTKEWPEPTVPEDLKSALKTTSQVDILWRDITPMARWDWIRWISSTKNQETRMKRISVAFDKLKKGERRPCCFNRSLCCDPSVSHNGVLLEPAQPL